MLWTEAGSDLSAYNTTVNADIADLRTALKIDQWNGYRVSNGSELALQLLRDHPEGIRSVVLDSVVPPQTNPMTQFWPTAPKGFEANWVDTRSSEGFFLFRSFSPTAAFFDKSWSLPDVEEVR